VCITSRGVLKAARYYRRFKVIGGWGRLGCQK